MDTDAWTPCRLCSRTDDRCRGKVHPRDCENVAAEVADEEAGVVRPDPRYWRDWLAANPFDGPARLAPAPPVALLAGPGRPPYASADYFVAPVRVASDGGPISTAHHRTWEGAAARKPWEYPVAAALIHLDCPDVLADVLATLRAQSVRPYLIVVDTGSRDRHRRALEAMELACDDLEVHYLRPRGWIMTSQPCAVAMDLAFAVCQTEYLYATHTDVFLKRRDALEYLIGLCDRRTPAVGWQMSPRPHMKEMGVWERTLSHTSTVYHMPTMRAIKARWNMMATYERFGLAPKQAVVGDPIYPDTEIEISYCFRDSGFGVRWLGDPPPGPGDPPSVLMLGTEENVPYENQWHRHVRSSTLAELYSEDWAVVRRPLLEQARAEARARVRRWCKPRVDPVTKKLPEPVPGRR